MNLSSIRVKLIKTKIRVRLIEENTNSISGKKAKWFL